MKENEDVNETADQLRRPPRLSVLLSIISPDRAPSGTEPVVGERERQWHDFIAPPSRRENFQRRHSAASVRIDYLTRISFLFSKDKMWSIAAISAAGRALLFCNQIFRPGWRKVNWAMKSMSQPSYGSFKKIIRVGAQVQSFELLND